MIDEKLNEHTLEFEHFKLHADSTLKTYTKERLIRYIHMLYDNWSATDTLNARLFKVNYKLNRTLQELVNKAKLMKPSGISLTHEGKVGNCPRCHKFVREIDTNICECGQRLDWSDSDEKQE